MVRAIGERADVFPNTFEHVGGLLMWFQYRLRSQAYESGSLGYGRTDAATSAEGRDV